jgi:uncharacterized iron-regulated protein
MENITELLEYSCGHCQQSEWKIYIGYRDDGETFLITSCANTICQATRRGEMGKSLDSLLVYDNFNITADWAERKATGGVEEDPPEELN